MGLLDKISGKLSKLMLSCEEATFLASKSQHMGISLKEKINLRIHLFTCKFCKRYKIQIDAMVRFIYKTSDANGSAKTRIHLAPDKKEKIKQALADQIKE